MLSINAPLYLRIFVIVSYILNCTEVQNLLKKIVSNTILFISILIFVTAFKYFFGEINTLVGVTTIVALLVLMGINLTKHPIKNLFTFLVVNLLLGLFSYFASYHLFLGAFLNFLVLTTLGYVLSYNLSKTLIIPLGLQYLFMLYTPVSGDDFLLRLSSLVAAPFIIMFSQYIIYGRTKKAKVATSEIIEYPPMNIKDYKMITLFNKEFMLHEVRASYALRIGILIAIATFIEGILIKYFNLFEGRWMVYTIFSLTELYAQHCRIRSKQRLEGTLIGSLIVLILFILVKDTTLRVLIIFIAGYLNTFVSNYRDVMIIVTVSAVASTALSNGTFLTIAERIIFVCIGIGIALLGNKYLFNSTKSLER